MIATFAGAAVLAAGLAGAWATRGRSSTLFGPSIWHGGRSRKAVALTFDDGPTTGTLDLLELLDRFRVRATFFQIGLQAERSPQIARAVSKAGHEIGNHTYSHLGLWLQTPSAIAAEVDRAQSVLTAIHGAPPQWFRAPYGVRWFGLRRALAQHHLTGVMWTTIARDWTLPAARVAARLQAGIANGAIYCLHDGRGVTPNPDIRATIGPVKTVIPILRDRGYRICTVGELLDCSGQCNDGLA